jgi:hypothetical protein
VRDTLDLPLIDAENLFRQPGPPLFAALSNRQKLISSYIAGTRARLLTDHSHEMLHQSNPVI